MYGCSMLFLFGCSMSVPLPIRNFRWLSPLTKILCGIPQKYLWKNCVETPQKNVWNFHTETSQRLHRNSTETLWSLSGISVGFLWNLCGISVGSLWNFCGVSAEFLCNFCGNSMELQCRNTTLFPQRKFYRKFRNDLSAYQISCARINRSLV